MGGAAVTLSGAHRERFWRAVEELASDMPPVGSPPRSKARWLMPLLQARVRYLKGSGKLRHATLCGFGAFARDAV
jgi:hypothetical protein